MLKFDDIVCYDMAIKSPDFPDVDQKYPEEEQMTLQDSDDAAWKEKI